jgi:hypothetical protein
MRFLSGRQFLFPASAILAALAVTVFILRWQGRVWWCECGGWVPWSGDSHGRHNSQHLFDPYTFSHVLHGVIFFGALYVFWPKGSYAWRLVISVLVECGWELLENSSFVIERYRNTTAAVGYIGDSVFNSLADVVSCGFGFWLAGRIGLWKSLIFFVVVELVMLFAIRDNLSLNVLMMLYPLESIKTWQSGL